MNAKKSNKKVTISQILINNLKNKRLNYFKNIILLFVNKII